MGWAGRGLAGLLAGLSGCARGGGVETTSSGVSATTEVATTSDATSTGTSAAETTSTTAASSSGAATSESMMTGEGPRCGDGVVDPGEACDDGNLVNADACTNACEDPVCGDGFVLPGSEECDDGNTVDGDDCTNACTIALCGDGVVRLGFEACDDGNADDGDACTTQCAVAGCGDGIVQAGVEECDDGNQVSTDACTGSCKNAVCGDGLLWIGVEECEDGNTLGGDGCEPDCTKPVIDKYSAFGPQVDVPAAALFGWEECHSEAYGANTTEVAALLTACDRANLMLACRKKGDTNFALLAHAPRAAATQDTGKSNTPVVANGSGWYFSDAYSWGFAPQGAKIQRSTCDVAATDAERRLCWHTGAGLLAGGFRCGAATFLNNAQDWERVVLHAD